MGKRVYTIILLCCAATLGSISMAQVKQQLAALFEQAEQYYLMDDYQRLEEYCGRYHNLLEEHFDEFGDSLDVFVAYYNKMLGSYYYGLAEGEDDYFYESRYQYRKSLLTFLLRGSDKNVMTLREELAQLDYKVGRYEDAATHLDSVYNYLDYRINDLGITSLEPQYYKTLSQLAMCNARMATRDSDDARSRKLFSLALDQIDQATRYYKSHKDQGYPEALRKQAKILMMQSDRMGSTDYKEAMKCYRQYVDDQCTLVEQQLQQMDESQRGQYWLAIHRFLYDCYRLGDRAPEMLYDLALLSKGYLVAREHDPKTLRTRWKQVRKALKHDECALEFVQYFGKDDTKRMGCLVLRHDSQRPKFIDLFSVDSLLALPVGAYSTVEQALELDYGDDKNEFYTDSSIVANIWRPELLSQLKGVRRLYFAPDGILHQWAIEYQLPDSAMIGYRLTSTRNLLQRKHNKLQGRALLCGGIYFNASISPATRDNDSVAYSFLKGKAGFIKELPYTIDEIDTIQAIRSNPDDVTLVGSTATDEQFLQTMSNNFDIVHLSTHGFYGGKQRLDGDLKPLLDDQSMSQCGIIFAGASSALSDEDFDTDLYDGVLSGTELARQDFSSTRLMVLSACQTGLGRLTDDGIYGMQRALKQAGVGSLCVTLWSVFDESSGQLMRYFYENLQKPEFHDVHEAFIAARKRLMEDEWIKLMFNLETFEFEPRVVKYDAPEHVNPFILIDVF